jgi:DNA-binding HxlR family transcriptional regulator
MRLSECPVRATIDVIEGKWKLIIDNALKDRAFRFGELRRHAPEATRKVLTEQLRELEQDGILARRIFGQKWERVEYSLTPYGQTLVPVLTLMAKWGKVHKKSKRSQESSSDRQNP